LDHQINKDGAMSIEVLSPVSTAKAVELARGKYKKQILPLTEIAYNGKTKKFDMPYLRRVVEAFNKGAYPYAPVKLAPADNAHTQDVLRTGGRVVGLELSKTDGLVATLELNDDGTKAVELSDGMVPVSVRMIENLEHSDGATFPVALHHVLITDDPNVRNQGPWKSIDLSADAGRDGVTETIDLSAERFGTEETMTDTKAKVELKLTEAQQTALIELAAEHEELKELNLKPEDFEAPGDEEDEDADAEEDDEGDGTETTPAAPVTKVPATVGLSRDATAAIELAQADASAARAETIELSRRLRAAEVQREVESWENKGLAPSLIALARPALEAPAVIELSNGKKTDAGAVVRGLLTEMVELAKRGEDVIELGMLSGALLADPEIQQSTMDAQLASLRQQFDS
jgi:hypothetical protein